MNLKNSVLKKCCNKQGTSFNSDLLSRDKRESDEKETMMLYRKFRKLEDREKGV